jgi:hypothetical protein
MSITTQLIGQCFVNMMVSKINIYLIINNSIKIVIYSAACMSRVIISLYPGYSGPRPSGSTHSKDIHGAAPIRLHDWTHA